MGGVFVFGLAVMCEISSSGEVSAEGLGIFVLLTLLVELLVVLKCCCFSKMYSKKRLVRKVICHETTSSTKATLKRKPKVTSSRVVLIF